MIRMAGATLNETKRSDGDNGILIGKKRRGRKEGMETEEEGLKEGRE